jgi:hypothetical protein
MSRSFRKNVYIKDHNDGMKKMANKRLRAKLRAGEEIADNGGYKKHFDSYDISDFNFDCNYDYYKTWWSTQEEFEDDEDAAKAEWKRKYRSK